MIKSKLKIISLFSVMTIIISCNNSTKKNRIENKMTIDDAREQVYMGNIETNNSNESKTEAKILVDSKASKFVENLKGGEKLSSFFNDGWIFIYYEYNRCKGLTDGQIDNLKSTQIDSIIRLQVKNNGDGWACDKKEPKTFDWDFDLKKKIADWDRFEIPKYENRVGNIVYVVGAGESDYLKLHYGENDLIIKLEYRSEDPG